MARADSLSEREAARIREAVGAVAGLDVVHLQCHNPLYMMFDSADPLVLDFPYSITTGYSDRAA